MYLNPMYFVFILPAFLLAMWAQFKVKGAYSKYTRVPNQRGLTGLDAAQIILPQEGLGGVSIEGIAGELTDHYDPRSKKLRLSAGVAKQPSVASLAVTVHEIGHALQDHQNYGPLKLRSAIVPAVQVSSWVAPIMFFLGLFLQMEGLAWLGIALFGAGAVFALITLPVEFNASKRGLQLLQTYQLADGQEIRGAKAVLDAAALTYVAALAQALMTLLYYASFMGRRND
jgi:Zn-dependent membrane protease YugP